MKQVFGIITALVTAVLIIIMAQMISEGLYPQPRNLDFSDKDVVLAWMSQLPDNAYIIVCISHGLSAFASGLISSLVAGQSRMATGMLTISVIFIAVMSYLFTYYFPVWFVITDTIVTAVLGFTGVVVGSGRYVN